MFALHKRDVMIAVLFSAMTACCVASRPGNQKTFEHEVDTGKPTTARCYIQQMEYDEVVVQLDRFGVVVYGDEPADELRRELEFHLGELEERKRAQREEASSHGGVYAFDCSELDHW